MQPLPESIQFLFDEHLQGNLSEAELSAFNERLATDPVLAQQWSEYQMLTAGLKQQFATQTSADDGDLRNRIAQAAMELESDGFFTPKSTPESPAKILQRIPIWGYLILTFVIVLAPVSIWYFNRPSPPNPAVLYAANFQIEQNQLAAMLDELEKYSLGEPDAERRQALATALDLVEKQRFTEAIPLLKNWLANPASGTPSSASALVTARYFLAQSLMATGNTGEETMQLLTTIVNDPTFTTPDDARWYLALCHLKNKQLETARPLLQTVAVSPSSHAKEATKLLQQID